MVLSFKKKKNNNNSVVQSLKRELQFISVIEFEKVVVKSGRVSSCCKEKWIRLRRHEHQRRVMTHGSIRERQGTSFHRLRQNRVKVRPLKSPVRFILLRK